MVAGASAGYEADRARLESLEHQRLAAEAAAKARRYELAQRSEASVAGKLRALEQLGWHVLEDRRWSGSKRANVDCILVGPGGVIVVDVKAWRALELRNGSVFCDDECRDSEVDKVLALTDRVHESLGLLGITRQTVRAALVFSGRRFDEHARGVDLIGEANAASWVTRRGHRLDHDQIAEVVAVLDQDFPPYDAPVRKPVRVSRVRPVMPLRRNRVDPGEALFDVHELTDSILQAALDGPIESWMTYLHPEQLKLVHTNWSGPARVRGPAGTGKTVVGLHRAAYLAERSPQRVLFVTFVKTLPVVLASLCERLSPRARTNIEFSGLHRLALDIIDRAGGSARISSAKVNTAFNLAWVSVGRSSVLTKLDERPSYWKEEIDYVIKGRGLTDFDDYAELPRLGRRTPMRLEHRQAMWELYAEYERRLDHLDAHDFTDALIMARDFVNSGEVSMDYGAVIVDEVQDLNLVGVQLLHALVGDKPDGLLVIGDGQQAVYPGGFTLAEAGVSVTGRAAILRVNYRNTAAVLEVAERVIANDSFDDLGSESSEARREINVSRQGGTAVTVKARDRASLNAAMVTQIKETKQNLNVDLGDMAVLVYTRADLEHHANVLRRAGVPHVDLLQYDGVTTDRVKLGTFKRAKGLEFKYVLLPGLTEGPPDPWAGECDDSYRERAERMRRELYVGMTRARDGLWLGYLSRNADW